MWSDCLEGQSETLSSIQSLFARGERLVSLTGAAGMGKTLLARRFSQGPRAPYLSALGEGTPSAWCDIEFAFTQADLLRALATVLDVPRVRDDAIEHLAETLSLRGGLFLVIDHADNALDELRTALPALLNGCAELRVLVTSREPLGLEPEAQVDCAPLTVDDARRLWREHARREHTLVSEVLPLLGGNALAIALCATDDHAELVSLHDALKVRAGSGSLGLDDVIDVVFEGLASDTRTTLFEASVFEDGFALDEAIAVFSAGPATPLCLSDLTARRLVRVLEEGPERRVRFRLDAAVRACAGYGLLRAGRQREVRVRHAAHYLRRASEWIESFVWRGSLAARTVLDRESNNLAVIVRRADELFDAPAERAVTRLNARLYQTPSIIRRAALASHLDAFERDLDEAVRAGADESQLLRAWFIRAWHRSIAGDTDGALATYEQTLGRCTSPSSAALVGHLHRAIAIVHMSRGDIGEALACADRARAVFESHGHLGDSAWALLLIGRLLYERGAFDEAVGVLSRTLLRAREHRNEVVEARALLTLAEAELALARHEASRGHLREALAAFQRAGEFRGVAKAHEVLARLLHDQGRTDASIAEFQAAVELAAVHGDSFSRARFEVSLGALLHEFGHLTEAHALLERASLLLARRSPRVGAFGHAHLAAVLASMGDHDAAAEAVDAARDALTTPGDRLSPVVRALRVFVILCRAREYPREKAREVARDARHELERLKELPPEERGVELRIAMRLVSGFDGDSLLRPSAELVRPKSLVVHRMGQWFIAPGKPEVSLRTRTTLATLIRRLGEQRGEAPGRSLSPESLIADMWPGEKIIPKAARNRLHVAVRSLRTMGLEGILRSDVAGYHLDPTVPFRFAHDETLTI